MDLKTTYLGMDLRTPLVASASPMSDKLDNIKRMEDAGISAVVLYSLFEEHLKREQEELQHYLTYGVESFAEAVTYMPEPEELTITSHHYLEHILKAKASVDIPIIASLNGSTLGGWTRFATELQEVGVDALELNIYYIPTDLDLPGAEVEKTYVEIVKAVKAAVHVPVAVKLSPFFSNMANMAKQLDEAGADGLVLFNRFYQPDIDLETLEVTPNVLLSTPQALRLPLRWIAILYNRIRADLAATSGIHRAEDALKMLMVGANVTMMASALLRYGPDHIREVEAGIIQWMEEHEYDSVRQMQGSMSQVNVGDASRFERTQYMRAVTTDRYISDRIMPNT
jgi:dihydroorotate dehydrogenase (fumarate)